MLPHRLAGAQIDATGAVVSGFVVLRGEDGHAGDVEVLLLGQLTAHLQPSRVVVHQRSDVGNEQRCDAQAVDGRHDFSVRNGSADLPR